MERGTVVSKEQFLEKSKDFFHGALSMVDDDLPDGAWWQMHEDIAENLINDCCEALELERPKDIDGNDIAHYYMKHKEQL